MTVTTVPILPLETSACASAPPAAPRRRRWLLRTVVAVVALTLMAVAFRPYVHELHRLARVNLWMVAAMAGLYLVTRGLGADVLSRSMAALGHRVPRAEAFFLLILQSYTNMLIPRAGMGAPAAYLKVRRCVPLSDFGAVQLLPLFLMEMTAVGLAGLASQWALVTFFGRTWHWGVAGLFACVVTGCLLLALRPWPRSWEGKRLPVAFVARLTGAFCRLGGRWGLLGRALLTHGAVVALRAVRIQLAFLAVGAPVNLFAASAASLLSDLMIAVSITPGALGFREGAFVYSAGLLGTSGDLALSAAVLDRLVVGTCNVAVAQIGLAAYVRPARRGPDVPPGPAA